MKDREWLQKQFKELCPNVYFKAPKNINFEYPCIKYKKMGFESTTYGNNKLYNFYTEYEAVIITKTHNDKLPEEVLKLPYSKFVRSYEYHGLYHWVFKIQI